MVLHHNGRLRRHLEEIKKGDYVYLRVKRRDETKTRHKLSAVAEGPLPFVSVRGNTVVIRRVDDSVERASHDRVVLAPPRLTAEEITARTRPFTEE